MTTLLATAKILLMSKEDLDYINHCLVPGIISREFGAIHNLNIYIFMNLGLSIGLYFHWRHKVLLK